MPLTAERYMRSIQFNIELTRATELSLESIEKSPVCAGDDYTDEVRLLTLFLLSESSERFDDRVLR